MQRSHVARSVLEKVFDMSKRSADHGYAAGWCVYFRSMAQNVTCEADIDYTALNGGTEYRRMHKLPCFIRGDDKPGQRVHCEHFTAPTAGEVALHEQWEEEHRKLLIAAMLGIAPWREMHKGQRHEEIIACPACQGRLHLSAKPKGQVTGRCETQGCVSWNEMS
jgi:hypothetical protein